MREKLKTTTWIRKKNLKSTICEKRAQNRLKRDIPTRWVVLRKKKSKEISV